MKYLYSFLLLFFCHQSLSQSVSINTDGSTANSSSLLDIKSTTKGLLLPRMTKAQKNAIATPATGLLVFQTSPDSVGFHYYNGTLWLWLDPFTNNAWKITGNTGTDTAINFIGNIDDEPLRFRQNNTRMGQFDMNKGNYYLGKTVGTKNNATAVKNIGIGDSALLNSTLGMHNIGIGTGALRFNTTGAYNTAIGFQAGVNSTSLTNATAVGAFASVQTSNTLVLGSIKGVNDATANVNVGIGTRNPQATLHIEKANSGSLLASSNRTLLIEDSISSFMQFLHPDDDGTGILSGNTETLQRSGIMFNADSSISLRSGGSASNKFLMDRAGNVGISNTTPRARLHVNNPNRLLNAQYFLNATAIFEYGSFGNTAIQLMSKAVSNFSIFSGTDSTFRRSHIEFSSDSALRFYAGASASLTPDLMVANNGFVGLNTNNPDAILHVYNGNSGNALPIPSNRIALFEDNSSNYIQLLSTNANETGILAGNGATLVKGGIVFNADSSMVFRTGGNSNRLTIATDGKTGIATTTPQAFLDVNNSFKLGSDGTVNAALIKVSVLINVASIPANGELDATVAIPDVATNAAVSVSPSVDLISGIVIASARVSTAGVVRIRFRNLTGSNINPPPIDYHISIVQ